MPRRMLRKGESSTRLAMDVTCPYHGLNSRLAHLMVYPFVVVESAPRLCVTTLFIIAVQMSIAPITRVFQKPQSLEY